jgi:hypothetical protein
MLETMNDYKKESQQTVEHVPEESKDIPKEMTLADSVYAKFQIGLTAVSNLNLKSGIAALSQEDNESYIPEEDETNQLILESALTSSTRDPMQAHILDQDEVADSSLEYASLLPVQGNIMPDDEIDSGGNLGTNPVDDYDEFLPSTSTNVEASEKTLSKLQDEDEDEEDEFASSLMAAAQASADISLSHEPIEETSSVIRRRKNNRLSPDSDLDDFEMISGDELAEVSP